MNFTCCFFDKATGVLSATHVAQVPFPPGVWSTCASETRHPP